MANYLTEDEIELIERYKKAKDLKISFGHAYQINEFTLEELMRLSLLIKRDERYQP